MSTSRSDQLPDIQLDRDNLYQEETFSDRSAGSIMRLTPVKPDGSRDHDRTVRYLGQTQIMSPMGALPLNFMLEADSLEEAIKQFPQAARNAMQSAVEEIKELQRDAASSIVVPQGGASGPAGPQGGGRLFRP
ncbi:MAG: hypothetical protein ACR2KU_09510 [Gammaproteobacteria bacterium]|nr:hypothetical protein [Gammaproteobacteria bacterium]